MTHDEEPPRIDPDKVVFETEGPNRFHDLMHPIWRCHDRRLHLSRAWQFKWRSELRRQTRCRMGRHDLGKTWQRSADEQNRGFGPWHFSWTCVDCGCRPPLTLPREDSE